MTAALKYSKMPLQIKATFVSVFTAPAFGYGNLYLFHIMGVISIVVLVREFSIGRLPPLGASGRLLLLFMVFLAISSVWGVPGITLVWLAISVFAFYIGYVTFAWLNTTSVETRFVENCVVIVTLIYSFVGVAEGVGLFRLPFSPYSDYIYLFGRDRGFHNDILNVTQLAYNFAKPTGFQGNPNTFGFLLICFLATYPLASSAYVRILIIVGSILGLFFIDSRSLLVVGVLALIVSAISYRDRLVIGLVAIGILILSFSLLGSTLVESASRLSEFITNPSSVIESTIYGYGFDLSGAYRHLIYQVQIDLWSQSPIFGEGLGKVEGALFSYFQAETAPHNWLLYILACSGAVGFVLFIVWWCYVIFSLVSPSASGISQPRALRCAIGSLMLVSLLGSFAPSGIFYLLPLWALWGVASAVADQGRERVYRITSKKVRSSLNRDGLKNLGDEII